MPAILSKCGTSNTIKFSDRPKLLEKKKIETISSKNKNKLQTTSTVKKEIGKKDNNFDEIKEFDIEVN